MSVLESPSRGARAVAGRAACLFAVLLLTLPGCSDGDAGPDADAAARDAGPVDAQPADGATPADQGPPPEIACGEGGEGELAAGKTVAVSGAAAKDLAGASVTGPAGISRSTKVTIACASDLVPDGFVPLGPAVDFSSQQGASANRAPYGANLRFTLPFLAARMPPGARPGSIVVWFKRAGATSSTNLPLVNPVVDESTGLLSFDLDELGSYQVAIDARAGQPTKRRYTYRAAVGFSMGGGAAAVIGLRHPELFDLVGPLGAEPGVEMSYFLRYFEEGMLSGFCTAEDEAAARGKIGELCPQVRQPLTRQHELLMTYERMLYQPGQGVGLTLNRNTYTRAMRDLMRAYGNPAYHNPEHPLLPPGVGVELLLKGNEVCGAPVKLDKLYDRHFNPDGSRPVITFCDGSDSSALGLGVFDPAVAQTRPVQVLLAVDVNGNGRRDSGEPVVVQGHEPYRDVGTDGKADAEEQGYDPLTNPDPAGDNHHYLKNPTGTEANWRHDEGEPYEDLGLDGVAGTCQVGSTGPAGEPCYDLGEGNGQFDRSPMFQRWLDHCPARRFVDLQAASQQRLDIWADAGIRDFLNAHVATNQLAGTLAASGAPVRIFDSFERLLGAGGGVYDFQKVDFDRVGKHVYVRYGDPKMSDEQVNKTGDGRHVGTALQLTHRTVSFFAFADKRWPGGDRNLDHADVNSVNFKEDEEFESPSTGQKRKFAVFLPPGYFHEANAAKRYPVVYFMHGYGMDPSDLIALSSLFANYMVSPNLPPEKRFQKFLIVYVDGRCRPGGSLPLPADGDRCEKGTFYLDAPDKQSTAQMETLMLELVDHIDKTYRTKKPADVEVPFY